MAKAVAIASETLLPSLVKEAAAALSRATCAAEILIAREAAGLVYDAARRATRLSKATAAHDEVVGIVRQAQADAIAIEIEADCRLADEVDAAKDKGDLCRPGRRANVLGSAPSLTEVGIGRKQLHHARHVRNALKHRPGALRSVVDAILTRGAEPTRSAMRRELGISSPATVYHPDFAKLLNGRDVRRVSYFELPALKAQLRRELRFLEAVENHVAHPAPDLRVGDAIGMAALKSYFDGAGE